MIHRIIFVVMLILTILCINTALQIEILNAKDNFYLPRNDDCVDGKWRISPYNTPRDQLREWINGPGLLQYILAPVLLFLSIFQIKRKDSIIRKIISVFCFICSIICIILMIYRGYFSSLCT